MQNQALSQALALEPAEIQAERGMYEAGMVHAFLGDAAQPDPQDTPAEAKAYLAGYAAGQQARP